MNGMLKDINGNVIVKMMISINVEQNELIVEDKEVERLSCGVLNEDFWNFIIKMDFRKPLINIIEKNVLRILLFIIKIDRNYFKKCQKIKFESKIVIDN